ncbi:MAG: hypothetical protein HZA09_04095 [Nitrospirae bacterium]|nr:hypothetical protein [Nitrospirota bacterium]
MKVLRGVLAGIAFGIIGEVSGFFIYAVLFVKWTEEANQLWRPRVYSLSFNPCFIGSISETFLATKWEKILI